MATEAARKAEEEKKRLLAQADDGSAPDGIKTAYIVLAFVYIAFAIFYGLAAGLEWFHGNYQFRSTDLGWVYLLIALGWYGLVLAFAAGAWGQEWMGGQDYDTKKQVEMRHVIHRWFGAGGAVTLVFVALAIVSGTHKWYYLPLVFIVGLALAGIQAANEAENVVFPSDATTGDLSKFETNRFGRYGMWLLATIVFALFAFSVIGRFYSECSATGAAPSAFILTPLIAYFILHVLIATVLTNNVNENVSHGLREGLFLFFEAVILLTPPIINLATDKLHHNC